MKSPLFFNALNDFIAQIPPIDSANSLHQCAITSLEAAPPLLRDYLNFYEIGFFEDAQSYSIGQSSIEGFRVVEHRWQAKQPSGKTLYFCHGYLDHTGLYSRMIQWGLQGGFNVHCIDFPGHGLSSGEAAAIDSFDQYSAVLVHIINRQGDKDYALIGQSTGCAMIVNALLKPRRFVLKLAPNHVVLLAPLVRSIGWGGLRYAYYLLKFFKHSVKRTHRDTGHDRAFNDFVKYKDPLQSNRIPISWLGAMEAWHKALHHDVHHSLTPLHTPKVLIVQGDKDTVVDSKYNLPRLQHYLASCEVSWIAGAEHRLANESDSYWMLVEDALNDYFLCSWPGLHSKKQRQGL